MTNLLALALVIVVTLVAFALAGAVIALILVVLGLVPIDAVWIYRFSPAVDLKQPPSGKVARVFGQLHPPPGEAPRTAPFSQRPCLYHHTVLEVYDPVSDPDSPYSTRAEQRDGLDDLKLQQGEATARVVFRGGAGHRELHLSPKGERIFTDLGTSMVASWLEERGLRFEEVLANDDGQYRLRQRLIEPGEPAMVGGRLERRPGSGGAEPAGYREPPMETVIRPAGGRNDTPMMVVTDQKLQRRLGGPRSAGEEER